MRSDKLKDTRRRRFVVPEMEGRTARWYARVRGSAGQLAEYRTQAAELTGSMPDGAEVLEVAPGPGYLAVEMARTGRVRVTGLDISRSFVEIGVENARRAGVEVDFRHGDAAEPPFDAESFDLIVCQAAFKNFRRPVRALDEMHRVLRPGGVALIQDLSGAASGAAITRELRRLELSPLNALVTRCTFVMLRRRAYTPAQFERLAAESAFRTCDIKAEGIGVDVRLTRRT